MLRRILAIITCIAFLCSSTSFAKDRDVNSDDLHGISRGHRYFWAIAGGTALGIGLGIIAPGGNKSAVKGALIGGSAASAFYLIKNPRAAGDHRAFAHLVTNTLLGTGVFWTICDCGTGAWSGAFVGGGGTAVIQAFGTRNRSLAKLSGTAQSTPPAAPTTPSAPASTSAPVQAGQLPNAPAPVQNAPAQAQAPATQSSPVAVQAQTPASQLPNAPAPTQTVMQTQPAVAQPQNAPAPVSAPSVPVQSQSVPAATQGTAAETQSTPASTQNPPFLDPEELNFSESNNIQKITSASPQAAPTKTQGQRP
ncbi:MAG TPA: hypothetical protein VKH81_24605 [Candidatus Angelobacter sp.]|nr:hypothetical protein [Candidatus Angelobacter sp.]